MAEREASKTAIGVAMMRAVHQVHDGLPRILDDPVVFKLLSPEMQARVREGSTGHREPRSMSLRAHVLLRSRFAEERLRDAVDRGVRQFVLLGAGLDTFAFRQPAWAAPLQIFEVDHPASQEVKRSRLAAAGIAMPSNLTFAPLDFEHDTLANIRSAKALWFRGSSLIYPSPSRHEPPIQPSSRRRCLSSLE